MKKRNFLIFFFWVFVLIPIVFVFCLFKLQKEETLPPVSMLDAPPEMLASLIFSDNGDTIGRYFRINRTSSTYKSISPYVIDALISTEDERFYDHSGIDFIALARAVFFLGKAGGASTITQQLSKLIFTLQAREEKKGKKEKAIIKDNSILSRINEKVKENIIATRLEKRYCKEEIIKMYLNQFDFLYNAVGIENASKVYFNKKTKDLSIEEAATLVGMCKNPSLYNPYTYKIKNYRKKIAYEKNIKQNDVSTIEINKLREKDSLRIHNRRNQVLMQWLKNSEKNNPRLKNKLSRKKYDSLKKKPIIVSYQRVDHKKGIAPYFREAIRNEVTKILRTKDKKGSYTYTKSNGKPYNLYEDGLKIYTTLNLNMQKHAEFAVDHHMRKNLQPAFDKNNEKLKLGLFSKRIPESTINLIIRNGRKSSDRYRNLKKIGLNDQEILDNFKKPVEMSVFSYSGDIDTTMSPDDSILYYKGYLHAGLISIEPQTGFVKAWVGGVNFNHFGYDHVRLGKRQVGSTIKPFVYCTAINQGVVKPCTKLSGEPKKVGIYDTNGVFTGRYWKPRGGSAGTVRTGLISSSNPATASIMGMLGGYAGPRILQKHLNRMNIFFPSTQVTPAMCLGSIDVSLFNMIGAEAVFVNNGLYVKPQTILRIEDRSGKVIYSAKQITREVFDETAAFETLQMMKGVVEGGTGRSLRSTKDWGGIKYPTGGKTGTTQNNSDGWFMGLTPELVTGVWVGAEDRAVRFKSMRWGQGARMALPIYGYYMQKVYADPSINISKENFPIPDNYNPLKYSCKDEEELEKNNIEENPFSI